MGRPILAVDVDGVISVFGFDEAPDRSGARFELIDGRVHCIPNAVGDRLRRLSEDFDLVWASGWEGQANEFLCGLLELPKLPFLSFDGKARFGTADWKLKPLEEYGRGRPLAWIDDSFDEVCDRWARERDEATLLMPTESQVGLEEVQVEALIVWARGFQPAARRRGAIRTWCTRHG
jgi:hypothetical protein